MTIEYICGAVSRLAKKGGCRDPFALASDAGVTVLFEQMGAQPTACKGFFLYQSRRKMVVVNSDLPENTRRIIMAHELGHSVLHLDAARLRAFNDFTLYDETSKYEYEANLFAAELLLEDEDVLSALNEDDFFFSAAKRLCVPFELLDFKFRILKRKGCKLDSPILAKSNFLKDIK